MIYKKEGPKIVGILLALLLLFLSTIIAVLLRGNNATKRVDCQSRRAFVKRKVIKNFEMLALSNRNEDQVFGLETTAGKQVSLIISALYCKQFKTFLSRPVKAIFFQGDFPRSNTFFITFKLKIQFH